MSDDPSPLHRVGAVMLIGAGAIMLLNTLVGFLSWLNSATRLHTLTAWPITVFSVLGLAISAGIGWLLVHSGLRLTGKALPLPAVKLQSGVNAFFGVLLMSLGLVGLVLSGLCTGGVMLSGLSAALSNHGAGLMMLTVPLIFGVPAMWVAIGLAGAGYALIKPDRKSGAPPAK